MFCRSKTSPEKYGQTLLQLDMHNFSAPCHPDDFKIVAFQ